jgi:hypothetical protein
MTTRQLSRLFHEATEAAGIKKSVTLHALRHSFALTTINVPPTNPRAQRHAWCGRDGDQRGARFRAQSRSRKEMFPECIPVATLDRAIVPKLGGKCQESSRAKRQFGTTPS